MSILTIAWTMCGTASLILGLMQLFLWLVRQRSAAFLLTSVACFSAAVNSMFELSLMYASSPAGYGELLRWQNLVVFFMLVPLVWAVYLQLGSGRRWLAMLVTLIWAVSIVINFTAPFSIVFDEIIELRHTSTFLGESFASAVGTGNPWVILPNVASLLMVVFLLDSAIRAWRTGKRRGAVAVSISAAAFILIGGVLATVVDMGLVEMPYMISFAFLIMVMGMNYELLAAAAQASRYRAELATAQRDMDRLMRSNLLGEMASALAHELNQPLTAILSNSQAAQRLLQANALEREELEQILGDIVRDDKRAGGVIARIRAMLGKGEMNREDLQVNSAVLAVAAIARKELVSRQVSLRLDLEDDLPGVFAVMVELQQVIMNLLLNAVRSVQERPLENREVKILTRLVDQKIRVQVDDSGVGVSPDLTEQVFQPFYTTEPSGMGMGLAICKRIVESYSGSIWAEPREPSGTSVCFELPVAEPSPENADA